MKNKFIEIKSFLILWLTQSFSSLGSAATNFALVIWLYEKSGSALTTAALTICSYAPYVLTSVFAGAVSDKWNKKTVMLISDSFAAVCTAVVFVLFKTDLLEIWHLYLLNALNALMNSVQQPAADVAITLLTPESFYQKASGLRSFSNSLTTILTPIFATALVAAAGVEAVIAFDLITFFTAFLSLLFLVKIPDIENKSDNSEGIFQSVKDALAYLKNNKGILWLIFFLAAINFIASIYEAALPAMILSLPNGGKSVLGIVNSCVGAATLVGSLTAAFMPEPKSRVKVICNCLLFSMSTENFLLAFGKSPVAWCFGAVLGWIFIPLMNANMDVLFRQKIPVEMQGRVYSTRNTLQFFTIPIGYFVGGLLVDKVFEPFMLKIFQSETELNSVLFYLFGSGRGSGAKALFFVIGILGIAVCLGFRKIKYIWKIEKE